MTAALPVGAADQVCPYLGLLDDPATHYAFPSSAQRCHAGRRPAEMDQAKQARDCLTARHIACPRYHPPSFVSSARRSSSPVQRLSGLTLFVVLLVAAIAIGLLLGTRLGAEIGGRPSGSALPGAGGPSPSGTVVPATAPAAVPAPSNAAQSTPTGRSAPSASPIPGSRPLIYVVKRGETLSSIAPRFGLSIEALLEANEITDRDLILTGQRLVIPVP